MPGKSPKRPGGILHVVATPIGNLRDVSERARATLAGVALVVAEDTRRARVLLQHLAISPGLLSLHAHNEAQRVPRLMARLRDGEELAMISDAGTPLVCDPGRRLVNACHVAGIPVLSVPGPCALTAALSISGLSAERFVFEGFPPPRKAARMKCLQALSQESRTLVFYEVPHRLPALVEDACEVFGAERPMVLARELTKMYEQIWSGTLGALRARLREGDKCRGEFVVLLHGRETVEEHEKEVDRVIDILLDTLSPRDTARLTSRITGARRAIVYRRIQQRLVERADSS